MTLALVLRLPLSLPKARELADVDLLEVVLALLVPEGNAALVVGDRLKNVGVAQAKVQGRTLLVSAHVGYDASAFVLPLLSNLSQYSLTSILWVYRAYMVAREREARVLAADG